MTDGLSVHVSAPFDAVVAQVRDALKEQGFGVLTTIDVQQTLKHKIGVDFQPYVILGACNPNLAHRALQAEKELGLLLPCNVIVYDNGDATCTVSIADPLRVMSVVDNPELEKFAGEVKAKLLGVVATLMA